MPIQPGEALDCGTIYREFRAMRIKHPQHEQAVKVFETLRMRKVEAPDEEQTTASLFAASHSGKTTTVKWYLETTIVDECLRRGIFEKDGPRSILSRLQPLALYVKLRSNTTMTKLLSNFLQELGDPRPYRGTIAEKLYRIEKALKGREIIFIDESQHIKSSVFAGPIARQDDATEVQNTFKSLLTSCWPVVFVGMPEAKNIVFEKQLYTRSDEPIDFEPLHFSQPAAMKSYTEFLARLSLKIARHAILPERPEILVQEDVPLKLNISSQGRLGLTTVIVRKALENMINAGDRALSSRHLEYAVERYSLRIGVCKYNAFREGPVILPSIAEYERC